MKKNHRLYAVNEELRKVTSSDRNRPDIPMESTTLFINQFAYSIDYRATQVTYHKGFDSFLGYNNEEITIDFILDLYHPDDAEKVMESTARVLEWSILFPAKPFSIVFSLSYRVRKSTGEYVRVLRQTTTKEVNEEGKTVSVFSICTDISHLKRADDEVSVRFLGPFTEVVYFDDVLATQTDNGIVKLSAREMDILALVVKGKTSLDIGALLNISVHTVSTHRRNMLARNGFSNTAQLIGHLAGKGIL